MYVRFRKDDPYKIMEETRLKRLQMARHLISAHL